MKSGDTPPQRKRAGSDAIGRSRSVRERVERAIRRSSTLTRDGGTSEFVRVRKELSEHEKRALRHIRIDEDDWVSSHKEWDRKVKKLKQVEDMDEVSIPEFFLRTAMLCQYMNNSLLLFYKKANSDGTQLCKLIEYEKENINVFTLRVKKESEITDLFSDYFEFHNVIAIGGTLTINTYVQEEDGRVREEVFKQFVI